MLLWLSLAFAVDRVERGNLVLENIPDTPADVAARLHQYENVRSAGFVDFVAGDAGVFVTTRFGETSQLHRVASPGAAREQLTFFDEPVRGVRPSPVDPDMLLLLRDVGGDESYQLWLLDLAKGELTRLSQGDGRVSEAVWSPDGSSVAYVQVTQGSERAIRVLEPAMLNDIQTVYAGEGAFEVADWFPGNEALLVSRYVSARESHVYRLSLEDGALDEINPTRKPIAYQAFALTPDGESLYVSSDEGSDFSRLRRIDLVHGKHEVITEGVDMDVELVKLSPDGARLLYAFNDDGRTKLVMHDAGNGVKLPLPDLPPGVIWDADFDHDGSTVGLMLSRADAPTDVYTFEVGSTELVRWTKSEVGGLDTDSFVEPKFFRYPAHDGLQIPAFVYEPASEGPHPVVISIHGGPEGQSRPYFSSTYQYWANELGIAVVVPNVRGSVGFGREYHQADNDLNRKDSVKDIGSLLDWIAEQPQLDQDRVVVYGGSYGGYMVLASLIDFSDRLAGGVDIVGISDFKTFLQNTKDYRRDLRRAEYGDERIPKVARFFDKISPLKNASRIQDPLFVIQGANDPRVPASEAEQIVAAVRQNGVDAWYLLAKDEGHGFRKKSNRDVQREAVTMFLTDVLDLD